MHPCAQLPVQRSTVPGVGPGRYTIPRRGRPRPDLSAAVSERTGASRRYGPRALDNRVPADERAGASARPEVGPAIGEPATAPGILKGGVAHDPSTDGGSSRYYPRGRRSTVA